MPPPNLSDIIFSDQANHNFSKTLGEIKRSTLSIHNRLQSIQADAEFAHTVAEAYGRPLIANERCGSWYIEPRNKGGSAYFKSTDGHTGVWKFSSRRLNFQLLEIIGKHDGCIIIDSTRRGKRMPDALSKTVPIWCNIINRLLFPTEPRFHKFHTPPQVVAESEHAQIESLLPSFLDALKALAIPTETLRSQISKPLRPIWITPDSQIEETGIIFPDFHPVICCTVSRRVPGGEISEGGYIQGAGDDTENWAHGLTPPAFWANKELLFSTSEQELPSLIERLQSQEAADVRTGTAMRRVNPTSSLFITTTGDTGAQNTGVNSCTVALLTKTTEQSTWQTSSRRMDVGLGPHKVGSRNLRIALPSIVAFVKKALYDKSNDGRDTVDTLILACENGTDHSIGVALAIACLFFAENGSISLKDEKKQIINKAFIRSRLSWFSTSMPDANPSRSTLQSVNSFLMDPSS